MNWHAARKSPTPYESLKADSAVFRELQEKLASKAEQPLDAHLRIANEMRKHWELPSLDRRAIINYMEGAPASESRFDANDRLPEAIVLFQGRPALLVQGGTFSVPTLDTWSGRLESHRTKLNRVIQSVGRVELLRHADYSWVGTAWVVDDRVLITNRHVASVFARKQGRDFVFVQNPHGQPVGAQVDFREEYQGVSPFEVQVERVVYIADNSPQAPDMALLLLARHDNLPPPIQLAARDAGLHDPVAVVGYPARDTRNDGPIMSRIFNDVFDVKRLAPGEISFVESGGSLLEHDCTTLGGNSGSPVVNYETGEAVGLHFSGRFGVANYAVKTSVLKRYLRSALPTSVAAPDAPEVRRTPADYEGRTGYRDDFLGGSAKHRVPLPELGERLADDVVVVQPRKRGIDRCLLDYTHFSIVMCKSRRTAFYTAVNIDGAAEVKIRRRNTPWLRDPRIPGDLQVGDEFYRSNKIDRGHLVRRNDPVWGSRDEAELAENDTFHFTNAAPQHENLNQKEWLQLEDHLLNNANQKDLKINVFTGPVFRSSDLEYRDVQIPEEFWKVVTMVDPNGDLRATAYVLSQRQFLDDLEFTFGKFRTYQTSVKKVEKLTGLNFGKLSSHDPLNRRESIDGEEAVVHLRTLDDLVL